MLGLIYNIHKEANVKEYLGCLTADAQTVMLCYGGGYIKRNGVYDEITGLLRENGKEIVEFAGIMANPTYAKVQVGGKLARELNETLNLKEVADSCCIFAGSYRQMTHEEILQIFRECY